VFRFAAEVFPRTVEEIVTRNGFALDDVGSIVPHLANLRILEAGARRLDPAPAAPPCTCQRAGVSRSSPAARSSPTNRKPWKIHPSPFPIR
jgi:3-oxoacyl-[acyl-carrier-protein] synthase III